jgi:hypothetical protein
VMSGFAAAFGRAFFGRFGMEHDRLGATP